MTAQFAGAADATRVFDPSRLDAYVAASDFDRPTLVIDVDRVEEQYNALKAGLGLGGHCSALMLKKFTE